MEHIFSCSLWLLLASNTLLVGASRYPVKIRGDSTPYYNTTSLADTETAASPSVTSDAPAASRSSEPGQDTSIPVTSYVTPECIDSTITYFDFEPVTVYTTVDSSYEVTVTASNASMSAPAILETPASACMSTIVYSNDTAGTMSTETLTHGPEAPLISSGSVSASHVSYGSVTGPAINVRTSTVVVTKKTPVPVVQIPTTTSLPPLTFEHPKSNEANSAAGNNNPAKNTASNGGPGGSPSGSTNANVLPSAPTQNSASGLASIIASVINSPFALPTPKITNTAPNFVVAPATPTLNGVPVTVGPSNVIIGSSTLPLPSSSQTTILHSGKTFTVRPTEIVAPSTTYKFINKASPVATITQSPSTVTVAGVTVVVGPTQAVISGTTYRIGSGAGSTTITVNGQAISLGSNGVGFPGAGRTTLAPAMTIAGNYEIVIVGGLTVSVDQTEAVISGTTLKIGAGATSTSVVISGITISAGPAGVGLPSTTIMPTNVPTAATASATSLVSTQSSGPQNTSSRSSAGGSRFFLRHEAVWWLAALLSPVLLL